MKEYDIPVGWKKMKLKDILIEGSKERVDDTSKYQKLTIRLYFKGMEKAKVRENMADKRPFYVRRKGEIIIGKQNYFNGSIAILPEELDGGICSNAIMSFKAKENFNNKYIYYMLSDLNFINKRSFLANGTGQKELSEQDFLNFDVIVPPIIEQEKIVVILENIDKIIEKFGDKKEEIEKEKEYITKKIFDENILNIDNKGKIKDIMTFEGGSQPDKKYFSNEKLDEYIRLIQIRDYRSSEYITYIPKSMARRYCNKDDVMIGRYGTPIFQILRGLEGAYNVALIKAIPRENATKDFIYYVLKQRRLFNKIDWLSQRSSGQTGVDMEFLNNYDVIIPTIEEQNKISKTLKLYDSKIKKIEDKCQIYKNIKKGLMQQLLTGKIRVKI